jgi:hypothetical protein
LTVRNGRDLARDHAPSADVEHGLDRIADLMLSRLFSRNAASIHASRALPAGDT